MNADRKKCYDLLVQEISDINAKWKIYKQIFYSSEENIKLLNEFAPICFEYIQRVLIDDILLSICRLTDPPKRGRNGNLSLLRMLNLLKADASIHSNLILIYQAIENIVLLLRIIEIKELVTMIMLSK